VLAYIVLLLIICLDFGLEYILKKHNLIKEEDEDKINKIIAFCFKYRVITILALVFLSTFRSVDVGLDTEMYKKYYNSLLENRSYLFNANMSNAFEFGFLFFISVFALCCLPFEIPLLFISLFVSISLVIFSNKISTNKFMTIILYVTLGIFAQSLNNLRQIISMAIIMFAILKLIDKKWIISSVLILLAATFHVSAFVCLILVPFRYLKPNVYITISFFCLTIIGSFAFPYILKFIEQITPLDYYTKYFIDITSFLNFSNLTNTLYSVALIIIYFIFFIGRYKILKLSEQQKIVYDYFLLVFLMVPLTRIVGFIVQIPELLNRVSMYFFISLIILIPLFIEGLRYNKKLFIAANVMVYIVAFGYMYYLYAIKLSCGVVPYKF